MRVLIIGATGLVGSALANKFSVAGDEVVAFGHGDVELGSIDFLETIAGINPDVVINSAVFQGIEPCEKEPEKAFMVNTHATKLLAEYCGKESKKFIYISTEAVFDEGDCFRYEEDSPSPMNYYGLTKYNGEIMTKLFCEQHYIFRLPIMFGMRENNGSAFLDKMYSLYLKGNRELKIADDVFSRPTYNLDAAEKISDVVRSGEFGTYHIFNSGESVSLYDFAKFFFNCMNIEDIDICNAKARDFSKNDLGKKALKTILGSKKKIQLRDWKEAMKDYSSKLKGINLYER